MKVSVCIPMYNESKICSDTAVTLWKAMDSLRREHGWDFEVIFSDDGSKDDCGDIVRRTAEEKKLDGVRVVGYAVNKGKGGAVREAVLASTGDIVLYTDCDLAYGTDVIGDAVLRFTEKTDILVGSRRLHKDGYEGYTFIRKLASEIYIMVLTVMMGFRLSDSQCGFKAFRGDVARRIFSYCETNGFAFDQEVLLIAKKLKLTIEEMPVKIINHRASTVHVFRDTFRMLRDLVKIKKHVRKLRL